MRWRSRRVVLPGGVAPACVEAEGGRITRITAYDDDGIVDHDLADLALMAGAVDTHVHCNDPGRSEWEGFASATRAAAAGGITTLVDMPLNSIPATTDAGAVAAKAAAMAGVLQVDAGLWGGVVPGNAGALEAMTAAGVLGFKCFVSPSGVEEFSHVSAADLEAAAPWLAAHGAPLLAHAEDPALLAPLPRSTRHHDDWLASRPPAAEASAIRMLGALSVRTGLHVHIVHVASRAALDAIAAVRAAGARVTAETCPHYLTFAAEDIADGATEYKCAPPIRGRDERAALRRAVVSGELDMVASDHSPAPAALKQRASGDFASAWGGIASLELSLGATWTALAESGGTLERLSQCVSAFPARLAGLEARKGRIAVGLDADLVAFDPEGALTVEPARLQQRHPLTPYAGRTLRGRVSATWLRGLQVYDGSQPVGEPHGRWLRGDPGVLSRPRPVL